MIAGSGTAISGKKRKRRVATGLVAAVTAVGAFTLGAWSGGDSGHVASVAPASVVTTSVAAHNASFAVHRVTIVNSAYSPSKLTVSRGTTVTWTNMDPFTHTVTSNGSGPLHSPVLKHGASYSYRFNSTGTFGYHCKMHSGMHGTVIVK